MLGLHVKVIWTLKKILYKKSSGESYRKAISVSEASGWNSSSCISSCAWFADHMQKTLDCICAPLIVFVPQECLHSESISSEVRNGIKGNFQMCSQ